MKLSRLFCARFLSGELPAGEALAALLTARGMEVDAVTPYAAAAGVVAGIIEDCRQHPNADRLSICRVNIGEAAVAEIVCGAPNVRPGLTVAVAKVGARLGGQTIEKRTIRGSTSDGMICSAAELGIGGDNEGILELEGEFGAGESLAAKLSLNDEILEVGISPNRGDCLSHLGIARELAAATGLSLIPPAADKTIIADDESLSLPLRIDAAAQSGCPYYGALVVRDVDGARRSPLWLRTLLERCGYRSVSAVVDVTNYLMLAFGQPLHAFDLEKLSGGIHVRWAENGETLTVLTGKTVTCAADTLLIADDVGSIALAGVMGGLDSGVTDQTRHILLEAAFFSPAAVRGRARHFKLTSEAAARFERGVDPSAPPFALAQAGALIKQLCGGKCGAVGGVGAVPPPPSLHLPIKQAEDLLGVAPSADESASLLNALHIPTTVERDDDGAPALTVVVPSWRFDLTQAVDIIEEIARAWGYQHLPETMPAGAGRLPPVDRLSFSPAKVRDFWVSQGFYEIMTYSFVAAHREQALSAQPPLHLRNPPSEEAGVMRTTLWGGLLERAKFNVRHRQERLRLFEIGRCFLPAAASELPVQPLTVAGLLLGTAMPEQWATAEKRHQVDFYDAKGLLEMFFGNCVSVTFKPLSEPASAPALHPAVAADIFYDGVCIGQVGRLHPAQEAAQWFKSPPYLFSVNLDRLAGIEPTEITPVSHYPPVWRDLSLLLSSDLAVGEVLSCARRVAPSPPVSEVRLFDFYAGSAAAERRSCGLRLLMQGRDANLTGAEIEAATAATLAVLEKECGVILREQAPENNIQQGGK